MTRVIVLLLLAAALFLFRDQAHAQPRDKDTPVPASLQNKARAEAINYWVHENPQNAKTLSQVVIKWRTAGLCDGFGGCALPNGCIINYPAYCWVAVCGKCYFAWFGGYDWLVGTLKHELGHVLGYNHGDPTCTMNTEFC